MAMEHASRVCAICKTRKKGCDKALPSCAYCTKRGLVCLYEDPGPTAERRSSLMSNTLWTTGLSPDLSTFQSTKFSRPSVTIEESLHCDVCDVFRITERTFSEVCDQYFRSFHWWLPIISQDLLMDITTTFVEKYPPADFSLLILAMILVTLDPQDPDHSRTLMPVIAPQTLYVELKMSFARVQAQFTASPRLIQATLLITAYEYACGKSHAAYISVGISARMASLLGISKHDHPILNEKISSNVSLRLKATEKQNIYWGIVMLERSVTIS
ncbi:hypothetical protein N7540_008754 [Penicillium herquei]|nr:hypothetical protein N7540_008754 [Penicillium herquei]